MDSRFWIWLLIIAGSFIYNMVKKKRAADAQSRRNPASGQGRPPVNPTKTAPMSFEDLLAEIQGSKVKQVKPVPASTQEFVDYDDEAIIESKQRELAQSTYNYRKDDQIYEVYDKAKKEAFLRPSLEETMKLSDTEMKFGSFKGYERVVANTMASDFAREIKTPSGFRKAFIMNEILQRKF